jgi:hypothetical protein
MGLVEKSELGKRTNQYALTDAGSGCHRTRHIPQQQAEKQHLRSSQQCRYSEATVAGLSTNG